MYILLHNFTYKDSPRNLMYNVPMIIRNKVTLQGILVQVYEINNNIRACFWLLFKGSSWSWSYGSWIYNYMCNQCLSPLKLWVWITLIWQGVLDTTLCDKVCQWLAAGQWFSPGTPDSSTNKSDRHDIAEILLKVTLNTINQTKPSIKWQHWGLPLMIINNETVLFVIFPTFLTNSAFRSLIDITES